MDKYRCGLNWNSIDKTMTNRYACGLENSNWHRKWPINIGAVPTQIEHKLIWRWSIDTGATPTGTQLTRQWPIDIGTVPKTQTDIENDQDRPQLKLN